jgi:ribosomal protein S18 acetylase RimI-like enzyme
MKSKELKILRKRLANANRCEDLLKGIDDATLSSEGNDAPRSNNLSIVFAPSNQISENRMKDCLSLFENNMGEMYRNSSWGLDMEEKTAELRHDKARFLFAIDNDEILAGFIHFRFEYDDEESPNCAVLYIFEIQIESAYRRCGVGKRLMGIAERIAREQSMAKVVLTVFKKNHQAVAFYTKSLGYDVDESSPSKFGDHVDYEILSLNL